MQTTTNKIMTPAIRPRTRFNRMRALTFGLSLLAAANFSHAQEGKPGKTFIDYFKPMPILSPLTTNVWGAATVGPRDTKNGLEDVTMKQWDYWDGKSIKAPDGTYHLSFFSQASG